MEVLQKKLEAAQGDPNRMMELAKEMQDLSAQVVKLHAQMAGKSAAGASSGITSAQGQAHPAGRDAAWIPGPAGQGDRLQPHGRGSVRKDLHGHPPRNGGEVREGATSSSTTRQKPRARSSTRRTIANTEWMRRATKPP